MEWLLKPDDEWKRIAAHYSILSAEHGDFCTCPPSAHKIELYDGPPRPFKSVISLVGD